MPALESEFRQNQFRSVDANGFRVLRLLLLCGFAMGCVPESEVRTYRIPSGREPMTTERLRPLFRDTSAPVRTALPDFDLPEKWRPAAADQFSAAAFAAGPDDRAVRITLTQTPAAMGLPAQLNRWRGQIGLEPLESFDNDESVSSISMGRTSATFVEFNGPSGDSIAGAVAVVQGQMWFFKMRGPAETVSEEMERLKSFCGSVRFATE